MPPQGPWCPWEETLTKLQWEAGQDEVALSWSLGALQGPANWCGRVVAPWCYVVLLPADLTRWTLTTSLSQTCLSTCLGKLAMLESLVRKADRLLSFQA